MWGLTLWLALLASLLLLWQPRLHERSTAGSFALHFLMALPFFALAGLFIINDTSYQHVAAYGGEALPLKYRFAATWAAREGPLLMWLGWMALLAWWWRQPLEGEQPMRDAPTPSDCVWFTVLASPCCWWLFPSTLSAPHLRFSPPQD